MGLHLLADRSRPRRTFHSRRCIFAKIRSAAQYRTLHWTHGSVRHVVARPNCCRTARRLWKPRNFGLFVRTTCSIIRTYTNNALFGRGALIPLFLAFALKWTYFDVEGAPKKLHAVRRHSYLGVAWSFLHLPLLIGICFAAAGLLSIEVRLTDLIKWHVSPSLRPNAITKSNLKSQPNAIQTGSSKNCDTCQRNKLTFVIVNTFAQHTIEEHHDEYPKYAAQWMVSSGVGTVMICMGLMGFCSSNFCNYVIHINIRLALRIAIGIACILFGLTYQMYGNEILFFMILIWLFE